MMRKLLSSLLVVFCVTLVTGAKTIKLLNVSYDPTREFYDNYNNYFTQYWKDKTDQDVVIAQSHGGSGFQARAVMQGLPADVVTLASAYDIDLIATQTHLIPSEWQSQLPNNSCPYVSTIVFVVRHGNPKQIKDWPDLLRKGITVITPNPKTSGGARWNYLAAWAYAINKYHGNEAQASAFVKQLFQNVPILETGAREASNVFAQRKLGDVLITWENEAYLILTKLGADQFAIVWPSFSILAEPPVTVVLGNTDNKGTTAIARAYLQTLYSPIAQLLIAKSFFRPANKKIAAQFFRFFPNIKMITVQDLGGWQVVQQKHFANGALFDQLFKKDE
jgi:sulfate/thiosulfate transport system substrate-binding protein